MVASASFGSGATAGVKFSLRSGTRENQQQELKGCALGHRATLGGGGDDGYGRPPLGALDERIMQRNNWNGGWGLH